VPAHAQRMSSLLAADKEFASCRSRKWGVYIIGGEVRAGRRERGYEAAQRRHARGPTLKRLGAKGTRRAHEEHVAHVLVRDAGGVKAQRLVEGRRALPSRREGMRCGGERCASRKAGGPVWCGGGTQEACTGMA